MDKRDYSKQELLDNVNVTDSKASIEKSLENSKLTQEEKEGILLRLQKEKKKLLI